MSNKTVELMTRFSIEGKKVLVTGSTQGIGFELARGFAEGGAEVYINGRTLIKVENAIKKLESEGLSGRAACFDVTDSRDAQAGIAAILSDSGSLDVLVNNAGILIRQSLEDMDDEDWERVIGTDLTAPFRISKYAVKQMIRRKSGKIINICSLMSELGRDSVGAYAAAKGGLKMLTRNMATEWARYNIQVNGIGPGYIATPINEIYRRAGEPLNDYIISRTPAGRWGTPEDLVGTALYLASTASDFVNGQIIYVDGGVTATFGDPNGFAAQP